MCNLYSITTNRAAIAALFRVMNRYVGNLPPMPGVFPDFPAPVVRNAGDEREIILMRWGMPPPPRTGGAPITNIRHTSSPHWREQRGSAAVCLRGHLDRVQGRPRHEIACGSQRAVSRSSVTDAPAAAIQPIPQQHDEEKHDARRPREQHFLTGFFQRTHQKPPRPQVA
jgi:hypothetical protein